MLGPRRLPLALLLLAGCPKAAPAPAASPPGDEPGDGHHDHAPPPAGAEHGPNARHDGHGHHMHHRFDDAERWAEHFDDPSRDEWQRPEAVLDAIAPAPDATIADIGAGTGYFAVRFARRVPQGRVYASDIEPDMVRYLTERAKNEGLRNLIAVQGSATDPRLPEPVDVAFLCDVYHHIEDPRAFFETVVSRLQPGGRVVIVDFKKDAPEGIPGPPVAMRVAQEDLVANLAEVGLTLVSADRDRLPHQYIVELRLAP